MNDALCIEKHKHIDERLDVHDKRLNNHSEKIDSLEVKGSEHSIEIKNLCKQIESLVSAIKWFICAIIGGFGSFFIWYVQTH